MEILNYNKSSLNTKGQIWDNFLLVSNILTEYYSFEDMIVEKFLSGGLGDFDWLMILKISL